MNSPFMKKKVSMRNIISSRYILRVMPYINRSLRYIHIVAPQYMPKKYQTECVFVAKRYEETINRINADHAYLKTIYRRPTLGEVIETKEFEVSSPFANKYIETLVKYDEILTMSTFLKDVGKMEEVEFADIAKRNNRAVGKLTKRIIKSKDNLMKQKRYLEANGKFFQNSQSI